MTLYIHTVFIAAGWLAGRGRGILCCERWAAGGGIRVAGDSNTVQDRQTLTLHRAGYCYQPCYLSQAGGEMWQKSSLVNEWQRKKEQHDCKLSKGSHSNGFQMVVKHRLRICY